MSGKTWAIIPYDEALLESDLLHSQRCAVKNGANQSLARSRAQDAAEMAVHEPYPLIPSFSPSGARRAVEGDSGRFMASIHVRIAEVFPVHEPAPSPLPSPPPRGERMA